MTASAQIGRDKYKTEITLGTHTLYADELKDHGGQDEGPEPPEYLNVALASCTAITLRMYADRKNIPLEGVKVDVETVKEEWKTVFKRKIYLQGELTAEHRQRLLEIADKCPVHKTLANPIEIDSKLAD